MKDSLKINKELLKLIQENPTLPIYVWVGDDVVCDDSFGYWLGYTSSVQIEEILLDEQYERVFDDRDAFKEFYYDTHDELFEDLSDEESEKKLQEICDSQKWQKVITLTVGGV